ncbi:MAG: radical SAM protein [Planctomycetota bacterium]|jgi:radical SAM protein with 4Fe4S-binding SPASM domain
MAGKVPKPRIIAFEVTRRCRYDCRHCRAEAGCAAGEDELSTEQCRKILSAVAKYSKCMIILTGGEPMERKDIYEIIRHGCKRRLRMVMASCGYLIDDDTIEKLKAAGISALSFSLDGGSSETHDAFRRAEGSFDAVVNAAQIAKSAGVRFQINTTITRINADEIAGILELAKRLGADCFNPFILVPTGRGAEIADALLEPLEYETLLNELLRMKLDSDIELRLTCAPQFARVCKQQKVERLRAGVSGCIGGREFGFISCRGDVQACGFLNVPAGNVVENGYNFGRIWRESEALQKMRDISAYEGACGGCEYVTTCGGCRARAYAMSGDYLAADPICNYKRESKT